MLTLRRQLKGVNSDPTNRPRFHKSGDVFLTPSSTPETPASWPPRPDPTGLGPTCVAGHVVLFFCFHSALKQQKRHHSISHHRDVCVSGTNICFPLGVFRKARPGNRLVVIKSEKNLKRDISFERRYICFEKRCIYFENVCKQQNDNQCPG